MVSGYGIPQLQCAVFTPAYDAAAIGGEGDAVDPALMPAQGFAQCLTRGSILQPQRAVIAPADDAVAIGGKGDA